MTTIQELKDKWFIDVEKEGIFPPQNRHARSLVQPYTDGNLVEPLIDGATLMSEFNDELDMLEKVDDPSQWTLYVAAMNIHDVKLLGENNPAKGAMTRILEAAEAGVKVYYLGSGHAGADQVSTSFAKKLIERGSHGAADRRFPPFAGQHQKFTVIRGPDNFWLSTFGSADFFTTNWDTPEHLEINPDRPKGYGPIHNLSLKVQGPAVHDVLLTYAERWNDEATCNRTSPEIDHNIDTDFINQTITPKGPHSVQVLRVYGIESKPGQSYSWADKGEFTVWASYINAIKKAQQYIYLEDQYFYPFGFKPLFETSTGAGRDSDIVYQLGEALKRGVDVIALAPGRDDAAYKHYEIQQRRKGANYLREISESHPDAGRFVLAKLRVGNKDTIVHSKMMLVDDELALVGSTNIAQRSMALCSESHMAVIDEENQFARDLRLAIWSEHMGLKDPVSIINPRLAVDEFYKTAKNEVGHLRLMPATRLRLELPYGPIWDRVIDPYRGPERD
jgi:phosphatidylserine/phosphatidylglycerophosphate/cardiolipin synthase-like enzyme